MSTDAITLSKASKAYTSIIEAVITDPALLTSSLVDQSVPRFHSQFFLASLSLLMSTLITMDFLIYFNLFSLSLFLPTKLM